MWAMVFEAVGQPLAWRELPTPEPGPGELLVRVEACGVCRTDLHILDGELAEPKRPLVPGHEIVGIVERAVSGADEARVGRRVGIPWLGHTCGSCRFCAHDMENLCDHPEFTGYTRDGGYATHVVADSGYCFDLPDDADPVATAPLLCAGLIGWRSLSIAGEGRALGIYGFGAAAHIIAQIAVHQGRDVYAFTSPGDRVAQDFARSLGAVWAGSSLDAPPVAPDAAIIFAPVGSLVPKALAAVRKGGRVVCGGIHMSEIPAMSYDLLWGERQLVSVANLTRRDALDFFPAARAAGVRTETRAYPLREANTAIADLRAGRISGAAVLVP
jgi:alcohol dehydrogenase, propanol-preferring